MLFAALLQTFSPLHSHHELLSLSPPAIGTTVSWQEHSKNDLRGWRQLLAKGGRNFKIDPQHLSPALCGRQLRVANRSDPRGCLVLNHDKVIPLLDERRDYNTTDDVLALLSDPDLAARYFSSAAAAARSPFAIALCFKNSPAPCGSTAASVNWRSLVDDFFAAAQLLVSKHNLSVAFILDGDAAGAPICTCLKDRWRPWTATFIPGGGQQKGDCMDAAFHSNDPTKGYDRFQVLNEPSAKWPTAVTAKFGKFVNSTYNYQVYEPKDQIEIETRVGEYTAAGLTHVPQLRFAINIDSSMFQTYAAGANGSAGIGSWSAVAAVAATRPHIAVVDTSGGSGGVHAKTMITVFEDAVTNSTLRYRLGRFVGGAGAPIEALSTGGTRGRALRRVASASTGDAHLNSLSVAVLTTAAAARDGKEAAAQPIVLIGHSDGQLDGFYLTSKGDEMMTPIGQRGAVRLAVRGDTFSSVAPLSQCPGRSPAAGVVWCAVQLAMPSSSVLELRLWSLNSSNWAQSPRLVARQPLPSSQFMSTASTAEGGSVVEVSANATQVAVAVAWSLSGHIYMALATFNEVTSNWSFSSTKATPVAVGAAPQLASLATSDPILMLAYGEGFCQNNEAQNKNAKVSVCELGLGKSTPNVLVAAYGRVADFDAALREEKTLNACDERIMYGAYDRGTAPSVAIFADPTPKRPAGWSVAAVHEGTAKVVVDEGMCGIARPNAGNAVLAGWTTAPVEELLATTTS